MDKSISYLFICIIFTGFLLTVSYGLINITISAQLYHDVVLPCRLPINSYYAEHVRWFNTKDGWLTEGKNVYKHRGLIYVEKPAPNEWNLRIKTVTMSFEDIYTCKSGGGDVVSSIKLVIETAPTIIEQESSLVVLEFAMATLKCTATGTPEPEVTWYRGLSEEYIGITGPLLKIPNISRYATDEYICRAVNRHGEAERRIRLTVTFAPEVTVMEPEVYASGGDVVVMSCVVQASPLYDAYWTFGTDVNGDRINTTWKYLLKEEIDESIPVKFLTMVIRKSIVASQDYGKYSCVAKGQHAVVTDIVELKEHKQKVAKKIGKD